MLLEVKTSFGGLLSHGISLIIVSCQVKVVNYVGLVITVVFVGGYRSGTFFFPLPNLMMDDTALGKGRIKYTSIPLIKKERKYQTRT